MSLHRRHLLGGLAALAAVPLLRPPAALAAAPLLRPSYAMADSCTPLRLRTLLGTYPHTQALKRGQVVPSCVGLDFADVEPVHAGFKRTVRDLEFDISELSVVTFLQAKAAGIPLVLMPAVTFSRFQQPYLVTNAERGVLSPADLAGKRVACRLYTATTSTWLRGILAADYGVDPASIQWTAFEEPHVASYHDPAGVQPPPAGATLLSLLLERRVDAIIVDPVPDDPRIRPVIADPAAAARAWQAKYHAIQLNHMVVVQQHVTREHPEAVRAFYQALSESKRLAGPVQGDDPTPFGLEANRRNLEVAVEMVHRQGMIPRRYAVDELFDDVTRALG